MDQVFQFESNRAFAQRMDLEDPLRSFRADYHIPRRDGRELIYFCGNSLGLQPRAAQDRVQDEIDRWRDLAVEGHFKGDPPWTSFHRSVEEAAATLVGAQPEEIIHMNTLSVNLHLLLASFYRPTPDRFAIIMEAGAFPSDQYVVESQVRWRGFDPQTAIIEVTPEPGAVLLSPDRIRDAMERSGKKTALVLFGGLQYFTGQVMDMAGIAKAAHDQGAYVGLDLAHAAGNVPLNLHHWGVDFAAWCTYKYLNGGPGAIGGVFIHKQYASDIRFPRLAGWYGYDPASRFLMRKGFVPSPTAEGWQLSNAPILSFAPLRASHDIFLEAGMERLVAKRQQMGQYLLYLLDNIPKHQRHFEIISPRNPAERGAQLSLLVEYRGKELFRFLGENGVICDWREDNLTGTASSRGVIRVAPVPMYNTFEEVYDFAGLVADFCSR